MRVRGTGAKTIVFGSMLSICSALSVHGADAAPARGPHHSHAQEARRGGASHHATIAAHHVRTIAMHGKIAPSRHTHVAAAHHGGISCVPFARSDSGIALQGNAYQWWDHADGVYARGHLPEAGSVLAFRSNPRMRLGHVAVVSRIVNRREVEIDQANWAGTGTHGGIARNVPVVDVSEANDWSAVRVGLGRSGEFGSVYPTYGFIYDRPDNGVMVAAAHAPAPQPDLNPAPTDLRPVAERPWQTIEQVAEAPATGGRRMAQQLDLATAATFAVGAIDRK